ncbi:unnamed protein product, partial [Coregonus sp. 'balchen']
VPVLQPTDLMVEATARRVFSNAHTYNINSISVNSDLQTYISTDDLRVNLWNLEITDQSFIFEEPEDPSTRSFFSEIISSISDIKFSHSGRFLMTRDYLTVKVWDLNMETRPVQTYQASRENSKPRAILKPRKVCVGGKRRKDEVTVDSLDFSKKILHSTWHPHENIIAVAASNNLYIFQDKVT